MTVPAAAYHLIASARFQTGAGVNSRDLAILSRSQTAALRYPDHSTQPGGVLAPWMLSMTVPEFTGRTVVAGYPMWQSARDVPLADRFFSDALSDPTGARRIRMLRASGARFVIADCSVPARVHAEIGLVATVVRQFGCVDVYRTG